MNQDDANQASTKTHTADTRNPEWESYAPKGEGRTDEQIRADVHQALVKQKDASGQALSIEVKDGVVTLSGRIDGDQRRQEVEKLVRSVPSVRDFRDQLQSGS
ncbi:MAG: BON domain-containing protein [Polyangiales bacterium]